MTKNILLIYNRFSGAFVDFSEHEILDRLHMLTGNLSGHNVRLFMFDRKNMHQMKVEIRQKSTDAVWVIGGDGTVSAVVKLLLKQNIPLGVLPGGTMNLLARDLGMDLDIKKAIEQLKNATPVLIDTAWVNDRLFLNICNVGISTNLTHMREKLRHCSGWIRWPRLVWYMIHSVFVYPAMTVELSINNEKHYVRTRSVTVSNNMLAKKSLVVPCRDRLTGGTMGVYVVKESSLYSLPRMMFKLLLGSWHYDESLLSFESAGFTITRRRKKRVRVMIDGELCRMNKKLRFSNDPASLTVLKPGKKPWV
jgi:diacylglycerol kinase family enzyme